MQLEPTVLEGRFLRLEPYDDANREAVRAALDVDPQAWALFSRPGFGEHFDAWWRIALTGAEAGQMISFAVRRRGDGQVVGTSSFLNIRAADGGVEIGATFFHPDARGGFTNPQAKRLMLAHAFAAGAGRVEILTDRRNLRSQAAIRKLGAVEEGILRHHKLTWTGHQRDTVVFSILVDEWPAARDRLDARLAAFG